MEKSYISSLLVILVLISVASLVPTLVVGKRCYLDRLEGGCPDKNACLETCRPCYRNIGGVLAYCVPPEGPVIYWVCRCEMVNGAPCAPVGPPTCPAPYPPAIESYNSSTLSQPPLDALVLGQV